MELNCPKFQSLTIRFVCVCVYVCLLVSVVLTEARTIVQVIKKLMQEHLEYEPSLDNSEISK